ncbi:hypothetical protein [Bradyrhizobium arachidis]|uniref:hypothetical protein n=1 Tax=Bradyrhizobium arachidis TaxID=858423 RepID=UPI002163EEEF|nr:hypothetical protein [Bradyrhizobium arachidis]
MDNRINEIRRKISALRSEMVDLEASVRDLITHDRDYSESAHSLLGMRLELKRLIGDWKAAGGGDLLPDVRERVGPNSARKDVGLKRAVSRR